MKSDVIDFFINDLQSSFPYCISTTPLHIQSDDPCVVVCKESAVVEHVDSYGFDIVENNDTQSRFTPDINKLFTSAVRLTKSYDLYAVLMTGIGDDGAKGLLALKEAGAYTIAEAQESCAIFGMPQRAIELGAAKNVLTLDELINFLVKEEIIDV